MDVYSWDWGVIGSFLGAGATIVAAIVALYISKQWKDQKGSEVVAHEAKEAIKEILDFSIQQNKLIHRMITYKEINSENFTKLQDQQNDIYKRLIFINNSINIKGFTELVFKYNFMNDEITKNIYIVPNTEIEFEYRKLIKDIESKKEFNQIKSIELIDLIRPYSLYQTTFKFKK